MRWGSDRERRGGIAVNSAGRHRRQPPRPRSRAGIVAIGIIGAAIVATFLALLITSRPYDPMDSTVDPQRDVPASAIPPQSSPKPSPSVTTGPTSATPLPAETAGDADSPAVPDDTAIQSEIERRFSSDATLAGLDVSPIVENGKVTVVGSVRSADLKSRVERTIRAIKGVLAVDNQLVVIEPTP